ncbi:sugar diacid recognition domain-containing protein [Chitinibacteraceae bacterium HSL-7]
MSLLSARLAQAIVTRTMAILPCNINVMDADGIIIGSGDAARIGERHEGAVLAISQRRIVEIDDEAASRLHGVRPGVNLPLRFEGHIIGTVGITGAPEAVRQFGELVRLTAEMMVEQRALQRTLERDTRLSEELVLQLIERAGAPDEALQQWALRLGVDLERPRVAVVLRASGNEIHDEAWLEALQTLQRRLSQFGGGAIAARRSLDEFVVLYPALDARGDWHPERLITELAPMLQTALSELALDTYAAIGHYFDCVGGIALSYQTAQATLRQPQRNRPRLQAFEQHRLPVLLSPLAQGWQAELFRIPVERLVAGDRDGTLQATLQCWFDHDLHHVRTADALHIHRNTLDYRLQRVAQLAGLDLGRLEERMQLYIAVQLNRLHQ